MGIFVCSGQPYAAGCRELPGTSSVGDGALQVPLRYATPAGVPPAPDRLDRGKSMISCSGSGAFFVCLDQGSLPSEISHFSHNPEYVVTLVKINSISLLPRMAYFLLCAA
jgi:hypothetical protein